MKNLQSQNDNSLGFLMNYDLQKSAFDIDGKIIIDPEIIKIKTATEIAFDLCFPRTHLNKKLKEIKGKMISDVNIPNSIAEKKMERLKGHIMLEYAKSLNRPVRRASPNECEALYELQEKIQAESLDYIDAPTAAFELDVPISTVRQWNKEGELKSIRRNCKMYFSKKEIEDYRKKKGPFFLD